MTSKTQQPRIKVLSNDSFEAFLPDPAENSSFLSFLPHKRVSHLSLRGMYLEGKTGDSSSCPTTLKYVVSMDSEMPVAEVASR